MSTFKIIKKGANNFWHWFNNDAKKVAISDFEVVLDEVSQTFVIVYKNGANVPNQSVNVLNIEVIDETDTSAIETFTNVVDLRSRLVQLGYTPYLSGIGILSVVAGTNVSIDNTDPANPIISATSGDLQNVTDIGNTTTNPILIPELKLYDAAEDNYSKLTYNDRKYVFEDEGGRVIKTFKKDGLEETLNANNFVLSKEISSLTANRQRIEPNKDGTYAMLDDILPSAWKEPAELLLLNADVVQGGGLPQISGLTIQGHTLVQGSRVVVTEYNVPAFNGIYRVGSGPIIGTGNYLLVRTNDANSTTELNNAVIGITNGTFGGKTYRQTTANPVINTTTINFVEFAPTITIDATPTDGSSNAVSSNGVFDALATKVDKVTGSRLITSAESTLLGNTSGTNSGDNATNTTSNAYADAKVTNAIVDGVTTIAPSQNAVFDALALKQNSLGFTPENVDNKSTTLDSDKLSNIKYPSVKSVFDWAVGLFTQSYIIERLTTAQRDAIVSPAVGLQIFNTTEGYLEYFDSFWGWMPIDNSNEWKRKNGTEYFNDFGNNNTFSDGVFQLSPQNGGGSLSSIGAPNTNDYIGFQGLSTGVNINGGNSIRTDLSAGRFFNFNCGRKSFISRIWVANLSDVTNRYNILNGFSNSATSTLNNGAVFIYDEGGVGTGTTASPNWQIITANGGVRTNFVTSVPVNITTWYSFRIETNENDTEVYYYINDVLVRTETTNIPVSSNNAQPIIAINKNTGTTSRGIAVDYLGLKIKLNNQR
jgi:hypothetical protein